MVVATGVAPLATGIVARPSRKIGLLLVYAATIAALLVLTVSPMVWLLIGSLKLKGGGYGLANYFQLTGTFSSLTVMMNSWLARRSGYAGSKPACFRRASR